MNTLASFVRTPAYRQASHWSPHYLDVVTWRLKKLIAAITGVTFGCAHCHTTCESEGRQSCIDCGASRLYIHTRGVGASKTFKGLWKKPVVTSPADPAPAPAKPAGLKTKAIPSFRALSL
jgi:hypothetical protein